MMNKTKIFLKQYRKDWTPWAGHQDRTVTDIRSCFCLTNFLSRNSFPNHQMFPKGGLLIGIFYRSDALLVGIRALKRSTV